MRLLVTNYTNFSFNHTTKRQYCNEDCNKCDQKLHYYFVPAYANYYADAVKHS